MSGSTMQQIVNGYRGMNVLMDVNKDRIGYVGAILLALILGGFLGSF